MDKDEITKILSKVMQLDFGELKKIQGDTSLVELGLESVSFIQFIVAMEEKFGIEIRDSDLLLSNFDTLDKLFSTLEQYFQKEEPIKKVLICDCDNVLWRGVAGEQDITVEKAHLAFQETLINLYDKGVLLCLCSKNQIENILKALETPSIGVV